MRTAVILIFGFVMSFILRSAGLTFNDWQFLTALLVMAIYGVTMSFMGHD